MQKETQGAALRVNPFLALNGASLIQKLVQPPSFKDEVKAIQVSSRYPGESYPLIRELVLEHASVIRKNAIYPGEAHKSLNQLQRHSGLSSEQFWVIVNEAPA